ncbi:hypothetical protein C8C83_4467 [Flavobacterium sp. 90]|nr:hypothetical protein C8C82_4808 [Flavobacterium sp. 81]TCK56450.1 hypothetical protein C8C83_4467 [Flavobacterium sp. 90]
MLRIIVFKRKNGKKESKNSVTGLRMWSAISPEGWAGEADHYAHGHTAGTILAVFLCRFD